MSGYNHILVGLDLSTESQQVIDRSDVQSQLQQQATERLASLGEQLGTSAAGQHIILGHPAQEMHRMAKEQAIDLIVVGSHGRHGLALIFGSTSNSVLHGATCDVLAVRIED